IDAGVEDARVELLHHRVGVAVDRRIVEGEDRYRAVRFLVDEGHGPLLADFFARVAVVTMGAPIPRWFPPALRDTPTLTHGSGGCSARTERVDGHGPEPRGKNP